MSKTINASGKNSGYGSIDDHQPSISSTSGLASASSSASGSSSTDDSCEQIPYEQMRSTISVLSKIGYSFGHIYNDLCAGMWFSYTLLFLQGALLMHGEQAGALVMLGQIGDALATPVIGVLADKYGTKRKWHIAGTALVLVTFPLIFSVCPFCTKTEQWWISFLYFSIVILLFQLGWAIVQITHLAMIPELARTRKDRSDLTAVRYSASVCSSVTVYIITWAVLHARINANKINDVNNSIGDSQQNIGPQDAFRFRDISIMLTSIGITMTLLFYLSLYCNDHSSRRRYGLNRTTNEQSQTISASTTTETCSNITSENSHLLKNTSNDVRLTFTNNQQQKNFLKSPLLYQNALLYVFSRLFVTTTLIYIPLWLDERSWQSIIDNSMQPSSISLLPASNRSMIKTFVPIVSAAATVEHIATVPLVLFIASFIASILMKFSTRYIGHRLAYLFGSVISIIGCILVALAVPITASPLRLYMIAVLFGSGSSITMISSLCITADMIGRHTYQGGFIYSAVTFADKLITGIVIITIETLKCNDRKLCPLYYQHVLSYACATAAIFGVVTLLTLHCTRSIITSQRHQIQHG